MSLPIFGEEIVDDEIKLYINDTKCHQVCRSVRILFVPTSLYSWKKMSIFLCYHRLPQFNKEKPQSMRETKSTNHCHTSQSHHPSVSCGWAALGQCFPPAIWMEICAFYHFQWGVLPWLKTMIHSSSETNTCQSGRATHHSFWKAKCHSFWRKICPSFWQATYRSWQVTCHFS